jgi:hypothetical protein
VNSQTSFQKLSKPTLAPTLRNFVEYVSILYALLTPQGAEARKRGEEEQLAQLQSEIEANQKIEREAKNLLKEIEAELEALAPQRTATIVSSIVSYRAKTQEATTVLAQDRAQAISHVEWHQGRVPAFEQILATAQAKFADKEKQYQVSRLLDMDLTVGFPIVR